MGEAHKEISIWGSTIKYNEAVSVFSVMKHSLSVMRKKRMYHNISKVSSVMVTCGHLQDLQNATIFMRDLSGRLKNSVVS